MSRIDGEWPDDEIGDDGPWEDEGPWEREPPRGWPMTWRELAPDERWMWFQRLWVDVCDLRERYRLSVRAQWWADEVQLEVLAALAAWVQRYDSGEWDDPPGKLSLLFDLERVAAALRDGIDPFDPDRDRIEFERHLLSIGAEPPAAPR